MSGYPYKITTDAATRIAEKHNLPYPQVASVLSDFLAALHETSFKGSPSDAVFGVYLALGDEAAWHFGGSIDAALRGDAQTPLDEMRQLWYETLVRMDSRMSRFASLLDRWSKEREHEEEQQRMERRSSGEKPA